LLKSPTVPRVQSEIHEVTIETKIPFKYHYIQTFPIFPQEYSNKGHRIYFEDGKWNVVLWPSNNSNFKDEIRFLSSAVDLMISEIEITEVDPEHSENTQLEMLAKRAELLEIGLDELNRQVTRENSERGILMSCLIQMFSGLLHEVSTIYNSIF
jgi:hypothetical protein